MFGGITAFLGPKRRLCFPIVKKNTESGSRWTFLDECASESGGNSFHDSCQRNSMRIEGLPDSTRRTMNYQLI